MFKLTPFFKKFALAVLVLAIGLAALPASSVAAAGLKDQPTPPANKTVDNTRLEQAWTRAQAVYQRQSGQLAKADEFIAKTQALIDMANTKGLDTSAVQAALTALAAAVPAARTANQPGAAIVASHNGFDASGKVTDRTAAIATLKSLTQVLKDTRAAMNGTGKALIEAVKAFRAANKPAQAPAKP
jgi:hypothetical protein